MLRGLAIGSVLLFAACSGSEHKPESAPAPQAVECPDLPESSDSSGFALWPDGEASELVPALGALCAAPAAPGLFGVLNEQAAWSAHEMEAAAFGVLHRDERAVATFFAVRVVEGLPGFAEAEESLTGGGATTTEAGGRTLAWGAAGEHVYVLWIDGRDFVTISASGAAPAAEATELWLRGQAADENVEPPAIPQSGEMPVALDGGPPLDGLPRGYVALGMNPISFMQSDFADSVTIFEEESVQAIGAAVVLGPEDTVVGTLVAGRGTPEFGTLPGDLSERDENVVAAGFTAGDLGAFVVGYDQSDVDAFVDAWEKKLAEG